MARCLPPLPRSLFNFRTFRVQILVASGASNESGVGVGDGSGVAQNDTLATTELFSNVVSVLPGGVIASLSEPVNPRVPVGPTTIAVVAVGSGSLKVPEPSKVALICHG